MTVFAVILITGFVVLLASRTVLNLMKDKLSKTRVLIWILGGILYTLGAFGQIGLYLGATVPQSFAIGATGVIVVLLVSLNFAFKLFGLDHKDEDLLNDTGVVTDGWEDNQGTVEFERNGRKFIRPCHSEKHYPKGTKVVVVKVDSKTGDVEVEEIARKSPAL